MNRTTLALSLLLIILLTACTCGSPEEAASGYSGPRLGDRAWHDADWDGIQDPLEEGVRNVTVSLFSDNGSLVASTITDENGFYGFPDVEPGSYYLVFGNPGEYYFTVKDAGDDDALDSDPDPLTGATDVFTVTEANATILDWDVGLYPLSAAPDMDITPTATSTPTVTATPTTTTITYCSCFYNSEIKVLSYDGSPGWSDCGKPSACHSIIGDKSVASGTVIGSGSCQMQINCVSVPPPPNPTP